MSERIVEIHDDGRYLSRYRGFLRISDGDNELARVPLEDISTLIISSNQATLSRSIITALSEQNTPIITCGKTYLPETFTIPYCGNYEFAHRVKCQIAATRPLCKQIWSRIVQEKIQNQAQVLEWCGSNEKAKALRILARQVRSGDSENMEAQAARIYWPALMGGEFTRNRFADDANVLFNYCYTILRSAVARSIAGAGLLPALGVHHRGRLNPFSLVDDLMEPYRPLADSLVLEVVDSQPSADNVALTPATKKELARLLNLDLATRSGVSPLREALNTLALSLVKSYENKKMALRFAKIFLPEAKE